MTTTHPHPATKWQLQAASEGKLEAIALPLLPGPILSEKDGAWRINGEYLYKMGTNIIRDKVYVDLPWDKGDLIFFQEEWLYFQKRTMDAYLLKSAATNQNYFWQPAEAMPAEAAQYWFEITDIRVCQCKDLSFSTLIGAGLAPIPLLPYSEITKNWDRTYPKYSWYGDRWIILLSIKRVNNDS